MTETLLQETPAASSAAPAAAPAANAQGSQPGPEGTAPSPPSAPPVQPAPAADTPAQDWYSSLDIAKDPKVADRLKRYGTVEKAIEAGLNAQNQLREAGRVKMPGENATEEDLQQFYEAIGAKPDVKEYDLDLKLPDGFEVSDQDKAMIQTLAEKAFEKGGELRSPKVMEFMRDAYGDVLQAQATMMAETAQQRATEHAETLRKDWGPNFEMNLKLADEGVRRFFGKDFGRIKGAQIFDETGQPMGRLGDLPAFANAMMEAVRASSDDVNFTLAASADAPSSIDQIEKEIADIRAKFGRPEYDKLAAPGGRLHQLMERRNRIASR